MIFFRITKEKAIFFDLYIKKNNPLTFYVVRGLSKGRGDRIRTCGRLVPNQERYRAALHPVAILGNAVPRICGCKGTTFFRDMQIFQQLFNNILLFKYFF